MKEFKNKCIDFKENKPHINKRRDKLKIPSVE